MNLLKFQFLTDNTIAQLILKPYFYRKNIMCATIDIWLTKTLALSPELLSGKIFLGINIPLSWR